MDVRISSALNIVLRTQIAAVQQHFIHVLMLNAWGEGETAEEIVSVDAIDLPNAMRIVDWLVARDEPISLAPSIDILAACMPRPGACIQDVLANELRLDESLDDALLRARSDLSGVAKGDWSELLNTPLACRSAYQSWLNTMIRHERRDGEIDEVPCLAPTCIGELFAHLMIMISQSMIHSFVHWHGGRLDLANDAWFISGAAMMHATAITNACAAFQIAPAPASAVEQGLVPLPHVCRNSDHSMEFDIQRSQYCRAVAANAALELGNGALSSICVDIASYYEALSEWQIGHPLPEIANPCVDFERVYKEYVSEESASLTANGR